MRKKILILGLTNETNKYIITITLWAKTTLFAESKENFHRRDCMGNILRRVVAFLLGIVFTITSLIGGVVGGAYYAYKYVSPIKTVAPNDPNAEKAWGDLYDASIEELVDLITRAMSPETNGEYTFDRLAKEYGLDLAKLLENMGIDLSGVDKTSNDWKALEAMSILSVLTDPNKLLESTKLKALYPLLPAIIGSPLDNFLSAEAQSALGEFTLSQLISADEATGEIGIVKAIKGLKIGSLLPEIFESSFDVNTHEYVYTVKQDGALKDLTFLNLIGGVPLQGIFNIAEGKDVMTELMDGELKFITSMRIKDILNMFADVAGEEIAGVISQYTKVFGDVTIADLFRKTDAGAYEFAYDNLLSGLEFGYLAGFDKVNGEWVDKDGNKPTGLLAFIADISLGEVLSKEGDVVGMINAAAGDLSLMTVYETIFKPDENGRYPLIIERLGTIKVSDVLGGGEEAIMDNLKLSLKVALDGTTLRDAVYSFVDEGVQKQLESIKIVDALLNVRIDSFIRDEYKVQDILSIFDEAIGHLTIGEIAGVEPSDDALGLLMDYKIGNIFKGVIAILDGDKSPTEIAESFIGQYRVGDIFGALTGFKYDESANNWQKDGKYVAEGLIPLMTMPVARFVALFDDSYDFDFMSIVDGIQIADVAYTALLLAGMDEYLQKTVENGKTTYLLGGELADFAPLSKVILTLTVSDIRNNVTNGEFWIDRLGKIAIGDLTAYVINKVLPLEVELNYDNGKWVVKSDYLAGLIQNTVNTTIGGIVRAFKSGDPELIKQKIFAKLGATNVGDIVYAVLELAGLKGYVQTAATDSGYEMTAEYSDFNNLANALFSLSVADIATNANSVDWWFEKLGNVKIGDPIAYFINKFAPDMTASLKDGKWEVTGTMGAVLSGLFNITVAELRDPDALQLVRESFGAVKINDVVGSFIPENIKSNGFIAAILNVSVNDIIDIAQSEDMPTLVYRLQEVFAGVTIGTVVELTGLDLSAYNYGVIERILGTDFEFLFGLIISKDVKGDLMYEYGDISLGEVVYSALKIAGVENVIDKVTDGEKVKYVTVGEYADFEALSGKILSVTVEEVLSNLNGEYWLERFGKIAVGDITAYLFNKVLPLEIKFTYDGNNWTVTSDYLAELIQNAANTTIGGIVRAFKSGDSELVRQKLILKLGNTNVGDIVYAVLSLAKVSGLMVKDSSDCGYALAEKYADLDTLAKTVFGIKIADVVENAANGEYWLGVFGETTIGNVVDFLLTDELKANAFFKAVRGVSVNDVLAIVKAGSVADIVYNLQEIFDGVTINNITELFKVTTTNNAALNKLLDTELNFLIGLAVTGDIFGDLAYEFNDISLSDAFGDLLKGKIDLENQFVKATLSITLGDIFTICGAKTQEDVLKVIKNRYAGVYVGDIMSLFLKEEYKNNHEAISTIADVLINDLISAVAEGRIIAYLYETFGNISIGSVIFTTDKEHTVLKYTVSRVGDKWFAVSEDGNLDELLTELLNVKLGDVYDGVVSQEELKEDLVKIAGNTTLAEFGKLVYDNSELQIGLVDKLYAVRLSDIVTNAFDGTIVDFLKDFAFNITIRDLVGFLLPGELKANAFMNATLGISANTVINIVSAETTKDSLLAAANLYNGVKLEDVFTLFAAVPEIESLKTILSLDIGKTLQGIATGDTEDLANTLTEAFKQLPDGVRIGIIAAAATAGIVLYFADNALLVKLVTDVLGEDATWGSVLGKDLGYTSDGEKYTNEIGYNSLMDTLLKEKVATTLTKGYPLFDNIKNHITIANLLTAYTGLTDTVTKAIGMNLVQTTKGFALDNEFRDFSDNLFNLALGEFFTEENALKDIHSVNALLYKTFHLNKVGDVTAYFVNMLNLLNTKAEKDNGKWVVTGDVIPEVIAGIMNVTFGGIYRGIKAEDKTPYIEKTLAIVGNVTLGDVIYAIFAIAGANGVVEKNEASATASKYKLAEKYAEFENIAQIIFGVSVNNIVDNRNNGEYWLDLVKNVKVGDFVNYFIDEETEKNLFVAAATAVSVNDVIELTKVQTKADLVYLLSEMFDNVQLFDVAALFGVNNTNNDALNDILDTEFAFFFGLIVATDIVGEISSEFGDISLGDAIKQFIPDEKVSNPFVAASLSFDVNDILNMVTAKTVREALEVIRNRYIGICVGDVISTFATLPSSKLIDTVEKILITDILDAALNGTMTEFVKTTFADTTIGDVCHAILTLCKVTNVIVGDESGYVLAEPYAELNELAGAVLGIKLFELAENANKADYWTGTFGKITLGNVIDIFLPEEVENNSFMKAVRGISVNDVIELSKSKTTSEIVYQLQEIFDELTLNDVLTLAYKEEITNKALRNLLDTEINFVIDFIVEQDKLTAIGTEFNDVTVGAAIEDLLVGKIDTENAFVKALLSIGVGTVTELIKANGDQNKLLDVFYGIFDKVTVGDAVGLFYSQVPTEAVGTVFAVKLNDVLGAITEKRLFAYLYETFGDVAIGDITFKNDTVYSVGIYIVSFVEGAWKATSEGKELDEIFTNLLNIKLGTIYDDVAGQEALKDDLVKLVGSTTIGSVGSLAYLNEKGVGVIDKLYAVKFADVIEASFNGTLLYFLRDFAYSITVHDLVGFLLPEKISGNAFIKATLGVSANTVIDFTNAGSVQTLLYAIADLYNGVKFADIFSLAEIDKAPVSCAEPLFDARIDKLIRAIADGDLKGYVLDTVGPISVRNVMNDVETVTGTTVLPDEVLDNKFINAILNVTVKKVYDLIGSENVAGDLADIFDKVQLFDVTALFGVQKTDNDALNAVLDTEFRFLLGLLSSTDVLSAIRAEYGEITLADAVATYLPDEITGNAFIAATLSFSVDTLFRLLATENAKDAMEVVKSLYDSITFGNVLSMMGVTDRDNNAIAKLLAVKINDVIDAAFAENKLDAFVGIVGDISLGDFIAPVEGTENVLLSETYAINVQTIYDIIVAENNQARIEKAKAVYANSAIGDALKLFGVTDMNNSGIRKLFAIKFVGIVDAFLAENKLEAAVSLVEDITLGDFIATKELEDINNTLLNETFAISVKDVYEVMTAEGMTGKIERAKAIYANSAVGDALKLFGVTDQDNNGLIKLFSVKFIEIVDVVLAENKITAALDLVGDVTLGDFIATEELENLNNTLLNETFAISVKDVYEVMTAEGMTGKIERAKAIYANSAVGDALKLFGVTDQDNNGLIKLFSVKFIEIVDVVLAENKITAALDLVGDVTLGDFIATEELENLNNTLLNETFAISVNDVYDVIAAKDLNDKLAVVKSIFQKSDVNSVVRLFGFDLSGNKALDKVLDTKLMRIADIALSSDILNELIGEYGDITVGDMIAPADVPADANKFLVATYGISVKDMTDVAFDFNANRVFSTLANVYNGVKLSDLLGLFTAFETDIASVNEALNLELDSVFTAIATNDYSYLKTYAKSVYEKTSTAEKLILGAVVGGAATALYFINNDLLVSLAGRAFGEDATWGDVFAETLGYALNTDGSYANETGYNSLINTIFKEKITATLTAGYPLYDTFKTHITLGNLLTASDKVAKAVTGAVGMNLVQTEKGFALDNEFKPFTDTFLNFPLSEIMPSAGVIKDTILIKEAIYNAFKANKLGDVLGFFVNRQTFFASVAEYNEPATEWFVSGVGSGIVTRLLNVTFGETYQMLKTKNYSVIGRVLGDTTLLNVAKVLRPGIENNKTAALVLNLTIKDVINCARGKITIGSLIGDWKLIDLAGDYLPDVIDKDSAFAQTLLTMTLREIYHLRNGAKDKLLAKFGEFTFGEALGFFGYDASTATDDLAKSVLDLKLNIFEGGVNAGLDVIINTVKGQRLGLILGYTEKPDGWYNGASKVTGILSTIAGKTINEISDPTFFESLKLGEALGYEEKADGWYNGAEKLDGIIGAMVGHTLKEITDDPTSIVMSVELGSALGYTKSGGAWYNGEVIEANKVTGIFATLADKTIKQIADDPDGIVNDVVLGEALGYTKSGGAWYNGEVTEANKVTGVMATMADKTIGEIANDPDFVNNLTLGEVITIDETSHAILRALQGAKIGELSTAIEAITLGEALGYTKVGGAWYNGEVIEANKVTGIMGAFAGLSIGNMDEANVKATIATLTLGDVIVIDEYSHAVLQSLKDAQISNLNNALNNLTIGSALGYKLNTADGKWYKDGAAATGIMGAFVDVTIGNLNETTLKEKFQTLKLKDVITIDANNKILSALQDTNLNEMSTKINNMELGVVMGYTKKTDGWYNGENKVTDGLANKLAGKAIGELGSGTFVTDLKNELTIGDIFPEAGSSTTTDAFIKFLDPTWTINNMSTNLTNKFKNDLTVGVAIDMGIFGTCFDTPAEKDAMDVYFMRHYPAECPTAAAARTYWTGMKISDFLSDLIEKALTAPTAP